MITRTVTVALVLMLAAATSHAQTPQLALWDAAKAGDTVEMARALDQGAKVDSLDTIRSRNGRHALNYAAWNNHPAAILWLLRMGAELEAENLTGFSALHHAAENGSLDAAKVLLDAGADPGHANRAGALPLETAIDRGHPEVARLLERAMGGGDG